MSRTGNLAGAQRPDKDIALPLRQLVARVERHPRHGDRRHPEHDWHFEALVSRGLAVLPRSRIRAAVAHDRPAVVRAGLQDVDLVAAVGAVLVLPHLASAGMHGQA